MRTRCYYRQWLWLALISIVQHGSAKDLIDAPITTLYVPPNAEPHDELLADQPLKVLEGNEDVALTLEPPSETISVSPPIAGPGTPIHLLVVDPQKLRANGGEKLTLKALALISGREHEVPIEVKTAEEASDDIKEVPPFEKENYELILEHHFDETEIAIVKLKADPPASANFSLIGPLSDRFSVKNEGQLVYITAIPCEVECGTPPVFTLLLSATNEKSEQFTTLSFTSKEEQKFKFLHTPYSAILEEEVGVFEKAVKVMTTGATGDVMYTLQDITGLFSIHPKSGVLMVQHPEFLTVNGYGSQLNLTVVATDAKTSIRTTIPVTLTRAAEGLKGFKFVKESYSFTVSPGQTMVGLVEIADAGNHTVHYDIAEGGQGAITIDDQGMLFYQREPEKDSRNFTTLVSARTTEGQFLVATAWVDIAVMGINSYPVKVVGPMRRTDVLSASAKRGAKVASIKLTDADDDAAIQLSIESISGMYLNGSKVSELSAEMFKVQMNRKSADLVLNERIFDLPLVSLTIELRAQDHAHAAEPSVPVTQHFMIVRKHPLVVEEPIPLGFIKVPKTARIPADSPVGTFVYTPALLQSVISNATKYIYDLKSPSDAFIIDNSTGTITTTRSLENLSEELLTIIASDPSGEQSAQANFTVVVTPSRVSRTAFMEKQYQGEVRKSDPLGTTMLVVTAQTDRGEDVKSYDLEGIDANLFSIDSKGVIRLKDSIANVLRSELNFVAKAGEGIASSSVPVRVVIIAEDDEEIAFEKSTYEIKVMENLPLNGYVLHPQLLNAHQGHVEYSINTQNDATILADLLDIDENGRITIKEELLGYVGTYEFQVRAVKGERLASADVIMHILPAYKCVPSFTGDNNLEFVIDESMPPGTKIGTVSAEELNPKCEMKYLLWDPLMHKYTNETKIATIDTVSGELKSRISFDYEKEAMYPLVLGLQAGTHQFAQLASTIRVMDVDDHPLEAVLDALTVEVPEDTRLGTIIATMRAVDGDRTQTVFYRLKDTSKEFSVNSTTGEVILTYALDRETKDYYTLEVGASNDEDTKNEEVAVWMTLNIIVTDVNDNGPLFEQSRYHVLVEKNALPGETILTVSAFDPDQPVSGNDMKDVFYKMKEMLFDYHGMNRAVEKMFSVGQRTGVIQLEQSVSDFVGGVFHLLLESMDSLEPDAHKDQCIVKVYVHDDSDIVRMELPMPPAAVTYDKISNVKGTISNATGLKAMVKDLQYHHEEGNLVYDVTDLRLVLVNRTTSEIIPAERAIAIADKHRSAMGDRIPSMTKAQVTSSPVMYQSIPPVAYVLCTFALLLTMVFMIFAFMMCHYRTRFQREKKLREDDVTIANALNRPPLRPIAISPMAHSRTTFSPHLPAIDGNYAVQEMKMVVAGDDDRRRQPW
ncbi:hypothetical protein Aduo_003873 [Ancylostoma duodenale]